MLPNNSDDSRINEMLLNKSLGSDLVVETFKVL